MKDDWFLGVESRQGRPPCEVVALKKMLFYKDYCSFYRIHHTHKEDCPEGLHRSFFIRIGLFAGWLGNTFDSAQYKPAVRICFLAVIAVSTEVCGIINDSFVISVRRAVLSVFFGNCSGIFVWITGNMFKGASRFLKFYM